MVKLNLPDYNFGLKEEQGQIFIFDVLRKRYVVLTPEEWVRQHFIHYLIHHLNYPKALIKVEGGLTFNTLRKRSDIVVFNREGAPWMMIECKAPELKLSKRTIRQASVYNHSLKAKYIVITNGMSHICCEVDWANSNTVVLGAMPPYDDLSGQGRRL
ncbi:MAG TPA: type I restriction enzyme HsdR N-terminal domain-containing protein [Chryseolinea sp.]